MKSLANVWQRQKYGAILVLGSIRLAQTKMCVAAFAGACHFAEHMKRLLREFEFRSA
jgi:hypothetical protein